MKKKNSLLGLEKKTNFYEFGQNNSGGSFVTDKNLCHRIVIEAYSEEAAIAKAEEFGCYWDGCDAGMDCPCCGDRWYRSPDVFDLAHYNKIGYPVGFYDHYKDAESRWFKAYGGYPRKEEPKWKKQSSFKKFEGLIYFDSIEQYYQFLANEHGGWTEPSVRIFYLDGSKKEIFTKKIKD